MFYYKYKTNVSNICSICYENKVNVETQCKHGLCYKCLKLSKFICPFCRFNVKDNFKVVVKNNNYILDHKHPESLEKPYINIFKTFTKNKLIFLDSIKDYNYFVHILDLLKYKKNLINLNTSLQKLFNEINQLNLKYLDCIFIFSKKINYVIIDTIRNIFNELSIKRYNLTCYLQKL